MLLTSILDTGDIERLIMRVSGERYRYNLTSQIRDDGKTRDGRYKLRFTIAVANSFEHGARTSATGRHMPKASWQAHRDVMRAIFNMDPTAILKTAMITYRGRDHFESAFEATGNENCGSMMESCAIRDTAV